MTPRLVAALRRQPLDRPPIWIMRQAGRYLPEYRELRQHHSFQEAVSTPAVAAELSLQPLRRFPLDGAIIFADIMTPLEAMGVEMTFDPGPRLQPMGLPQVVELGSLDPARVAFTAETVRRVRDALPPEVAVIGFAGAPVTLLAYLLQGGGSRDFLDFRARLRRDPDGSETALAVLAEAMNAYLTVQVEGGADVIQLFDTWAGLLDTDLYERLAIPAARRALAGLGVPTIYFAPGASHTLASQPAIGADGYGLDWRLPLTTAWKELGEVAVQGNLDPALMLTDPVTVQEAAGRLLTSTGGRPGHIVNLGHGIDCHTPVENVSALVEAVRDFRS